MIVYTTVKNEIFFMFILKNLTSILVKVKVIEHFIKHLCKILKYLLVKFFARSLQDLNKILKNLTCILVKIRILQDLV